MKQPQEQQHEAVQITPMQAARLMEKMRARDQMMAALQDEVNATLASRSIGACTVTGAQLDGEAPFLTIVRKKPTA